MNIKSRYAAQVLANSFKQIAEDKSKILTSSSDGSYGVITRDRNADSLADMAELVRLMNERIYDLENQVSYLQKSTMQCHD